MSVFMWTSAAIWRLYTIFKNISNAAGISHRIHNRKVVKGLKSSTPQHCLKMLRVAELLPCFIFNTLKNNHQKHYR